MPAAAGGQAHLVVRDRVVAPDPGPFTATLSAEYDYGNGARLVRRDSGLEPVIWRDWLKTTAAAPDRVIASPEAISNWYGFRSGALDGAVVQVFRIENGAFRLVRESRVPEGGFHASGWAPLLPGARAIAPEARRMTLYWDRANRPGGVYHFALRAIDREGRLSAWSNAVRATSPDPAVKKPPAWRRELIGIKRAQVHRPPERSSPAGPRDLAVRARADGGIDLSWRHDGGAGLAGFVLYRSDVPPEAHRGYFIDLTPDPATPIARGDLVQLGTRFTTISRKRLFTQRVWAGSGRTGGGYLRPFFLRFYPDEDPKKTWRLAAHAPDTPVEDAGETYLELELARGARARLGLGNNSGTEQDWYEVFEPGQPYRVTFWARADRRVRVRVEHQGFHGRAPQRIPPLVFEIGPAWKEYSATFTPRARDPGRAAGIMNLIVAGPVTFAMDNFRIYRADRPYLAVHPRDLDRLAASGMGALRFQQLSTTRQRTYDLEQLTNPGGVASGPRLQMTLPRALRFAETTGTEPWLTLEPHLTRAEWLGLVEYLAAPYDPARDTPARKPWAAKRAASGRVRPWTEAFGRILIELGNETWSWLYRPWYFEPLSDAATGQRLSRGMVYGLWQERVSGILRESPYWSAALEEQIVTVLGGQEVYPGFGAEAAARAPSSDILTTGAYIGGWEAGVPPPRETPAVFSELMTHVLQTGAALGREHAARAGRIARARGRALALGTYEAGPGYVMQGRDRRRLDAETAASQERVKKSLALGTATLDNFLARALLGYRDQNFYEFGAGPLWKSHAFAHKGGHAYPSWQMLSLYNREAQGDFLAVETLAAPRVDLPEGKNRIAVRGGPLIAAYATRKGNRLAVIVVSRRVAHYPDAGDDGVTRVRVDLPIRGAARLTEIAMTGVYDSHNVDAETVRPVETVRAVPGSLPRLDIPALAPGTARFFLFDGVF